MKKIFTIALAAIAFCSFGSCNGGKANAAADPEFQAKVDSFSIEFGEMVGSQMLAQFRHSPDSATFNKDEFVKGVMASLNVDTANVSYMRGMQLGMQIQGTFTGLAKEGVNLSQDKFIAAFKAALNKTELASQEQLMQMGMGVQQKIQGLVEQAKQNTPEAKKNKADGEAFIKDQMAKDAAYKKTESGLVYKVLAEGEGETFQMNDRINVKYVGTLIDGTQFDAGKTVFSPRQLTDGLQEALLMMKPGAHYQIIVPAELAYVANGAGDMIRPNATLVFDIDSVSIAAPAPAPAAPAIKPAK